jgi:hypothetical protein
MARKMRGRKRIAGILRERGNTSSIMVRNGPSIMRRDGSAGTND